MIWDSVCILLTVYIDTRGRVAGRDGVESMIETCSALASWVETASARRACLHAAQPFRILSHRKPADGTAFQSVRTLFMAGLVLGVYILTNPKSIHSYKTVDREPFGLADDYVDWKLVGDEGYSSSPSPRSENGDLAEDKAVRFIRLGGPAVINREVYHPGTCHAQRIILEFASLLDEVGTHWMADCAQLWDIVHVTMTVSALNCVKRIT